MNTISLIKKLSLVFLVMTIAPSSWAERTCTFQGKSVDPDHDQDFAEKTGFLKCLDGKVLVLEREYKNGERVGMETSIDSDGNKLIEPAGDRSSWNGTARVYSAQNKLLKEESYKDGQRVGLEKQFYPDGKPKRFAFYIKNIEKFSVNYLANGQIQYLECPEGGSLSKEDSGLCGYSGKPSVVSFYDANGQIQNTKTFFLGREQKDTEYINGKLTGTTTKTADGRSVSVANYPSGKVKMRAEHKGDKLDGEMKTFAESGQVESVSQYLDGKIVSEDEYFLNGKLKSQSKIRKVDNSNLVERKYFYDTGKPESEGTYRETTKNESYFGWYSFRWTYEMPIGVHTTYSINGSMVARTYYTDGYVSRVISYDKNGKIKMDQSYFKDGSRKLNK